jgi:hypothetical protein
MRGSGTDQGPPPLRPQKNGARRRSPTPAPDRSSSTTPISGLPDICPPPPAALASQDPSTPRRRRRHRGRCPTHRSTRPSDPDPLVCYTHDLTLCSLAGGHGGAEARAPAGGAGDAARLRGQLRPARGHRGGHRTGPPALAPSPDRVYACAPRPLRNGKGFRFDVCVLLRCAWRSSAPGRGRRWT